VNICTIIDRVAGPPACQLCGDPGVGPEICLGCYRDLPRARYPCPTCARPCSVPGSCVECVSRPPVFARATATFVYGFPVDRMIRRLKYRGRLPHARLLGELLGHAVRRFKTPPAAIVPVPLHRRRLRQRGFNQAREIAAAVARVTALPLRDRLCARRLDTPPLWSLDPSRRRSELTQAFECRDTPPPRVAIVDDVLTTGATATSLATILRRAGALHVEVWAVARSPGTHMPASRPRCVASSDPTQPLASE
jgi:ComF family protein